MLIKAAELLPIKLSSSWIVGDKASDIQAGKNAGLKIGFHVSTGHGSDYSERETAIDIATSLFKVVAIDSVADLLFSIEIFA